MLRFGAVTHQARVYLNGTMVCEHQGGFLPFEAEIGSKVTAGKNLLCVAVDNRVNYGTLPIGNEIGAAFFGADLPDIPSVNQTLQKPHNAPNFDFFNYAGINRPVKLYTTPIAHIRDIEIVPRIEGERAEVSYCVICEGGDESSKVRIRILDQEGYEIADQTGCEGSLWIDKPTLWEPGKGYLYTACV